MKRMRNRLQEAAEDWPYLLVAVPILADVIARGGRPVGARAVLVDLVTTVLVALLVSAIQRKNRQLDERAITDKLTGLYNSRHLRGELDRQILLAQRTRSPLSMLFMDLDGMKAVNDRLGHAAGDEVLRRFGERLYDVVRRDVDECFRFGGDEFLVLCPQTTLAVAREVAQRVFETPAAVPACRDAGVTLSLAVVELRPGERAFEFLSRADRVLYSVKQGGKNRVAADKGPAA